MDKNQTKIIQVDTYDGDCFGVRLSSGHTILLELGGRIREPAFIALIERGIFDQPQTDGERLYWPGGPSFTLEEIIAMVAQGDGKPRAEANRSTTAAKKRTAPRLIMKGVIGLGGALCLLFWLVLIFYALFLGGSPGPAYERTVPIAYAGVMTLGLFGAALGLAVLVRGKKGRLGLLLAVLFGAIGSLPLFLLELYAVGWLAFIVGIAPLLGLLLRKG